jgi:hypothetical protein
MRKLFRPTLLALVAVVALSFSPKISAQVAISVSFGPPPLPVYEQPVCPDDGYIWTPGYWAWDPDYDDYYWVPGTWVEAPEVGYLWTPPWWGWDNGVYLFHEGFWGPTVGFYGGIDYGFGYFGHGFDGGRWQNNHFYYNRAVMNVNVTNIHNVYEERVNNVTVNHVSYNGGSGGINARPTPQEEAAANGRHAGPVAAQQELVRNAQSNPDLRATQNHGRPPIAATPRATEFNGNGVVAARAAGGEYHPPANRGNAGPAENRGAQPNAENNRSATHPNELPALERPAAPNTGNAKLDKKYQQQQQKLYNQQQKERQQLQAHQEQEHQRMQKATPQQSQQMEQRHQQQTQHLQQRQTQQQQHMQQRQQPPHKQ